MNHKIHSTLLLCLTLSWIHAPVSMAETPPYRDPSIALDDRVEDLLGRLNLDEKILTISHSRKNLDRHGIGYQICGEALHGYVGPVRQAATVFPQCIGLGATWNPELVQAMGDVISTEIRAMYHNGTAENWGKKAPLFLMAPDINIARDPRWGRTQETYSEDPYMLAQFAKAYVKGMQGDHPKYLKVVTAPKHFVANNEEHNRFSADPQIDEKTLREYYLPAFKAAIVEGESRSIMTAYNALNGIPCVANHWLQTELLKGDWGFTGFTLPDFGSPLWMIKGESWAAHEGHGYAKDKVESAWMCLNAGLDFDVFSPVYEQGLKKAYEQGKVTMERIDDATRRCLRARFELGEFDPDEMVPYSSIPYSKVACEEHIALSREAARQSMVLLKNEKGLLPLDPEKVKSVALIGPNADKVNYGNYSGFSKNPYTVLKGLKTLYPQIEFVYVPWNKSATFEPILQEYISLLGPDGVPSWKSTFYRNQRADGDAVASHWDKVIDFNWTLDKGPRQEMGKKEYSARWTTTLMPPKSGQYLFRIEHTDGATIDINGIRVYSSWYLGKNLKTSEIPVQLEANVPTEVVIKYKARELTEQLRLVWALPGAQSSDSGSEVEVAQKADAVIAVMGMTTAFEGEGKDRSAPGLPDDQISVLKEVFAANPKTVVVLQNGSSVESPWLGENAPAILEAWYPGEQGGLAVAETVFGANNPGGKLPLTFPKSWDDLPAFDDYKVVNGRTYMYMEKEPLFPFGFGLSYTAFEIGNLTLESERVKEDDSIKLSVEIANTGGRDGDEIVQVYVADISNKALNLPMQRLKAFKRISLKTGGKKMVNLTIPVRELAYWNTEKKQFSVEPGNYEIRVGRSSKEIVAKAGIRVED